MSYPRDRGEPLISLQDRSLGTDASAAHLALGAFVGPDRVIFDLPANLIIRDDAQLEVLISPAAPRPGDIIERIRPLQVLIRSLDTSPDSRVALVPLAQDSRYGAALPGITRDELQQALEGAREIWSALIELRVVPRVLRDVDPTTALSRITEIETLQRNRLVTQSLGRSPNEIADCPFSNQTLCARGGFLLERP
jgi:hypothetical protein